MEMSLISYYVAINFNIFKTFVIVEDDFSYLISTLNHKITIIRCCSTNIEYDMLYLCRKLVYSERIDYFSLPIHVKKLFDNNHRSMVKKFIYEY